MFSEAYLRSARSKEAETTPLAVLSMSLVLVEGGPLVQFSQRQSWSTDSAEKRTAQGLTKSIQFSDIPTSDEHFSSVGITFVDLSAKVDNSLPRKTILPQSEIQEPSLKFTEMFPSSDILISAVKLPVGGWLQTTIRVDASEASAIQPSGTPIATTPSPTLVGVSQTFEIQPSTTLLAETTASVLADVSQTYTIQPSATIITERQSSILIESHTSFNSPSLQGTLTELSAPVISMTTQPILATHLYETRFVTSSMFVTGVTPESQIVMNTMSIAHHVTSTTYKISFMASSISKFQSESASLTNTVPESSKFIESRIPETAFVTNTISKSSFVTSTISESSFVTSTILESSFVTNTISESSFVTNTISESSFVTNTISESSFVTNTISESSIVTNTISETSIATSAISESLFGRIIPESSLAQNTILESSFVTNAVSESSFVTNTMSESSFVATALPESSSVTTTISKLPPVTVAAYPPTSGTDVTQPTVDGGRNNTGNWVVKNFRILPSVDVNSAQFRTSLERGLANCYYLSRIRREEIRSGTYIPLNRQRRKRFTSSDMDNSTRVDIISTTKRGSNTSVDAVYVVEENGQILTSMAAIDQLSLLSDQEVAIQTGLVVGSPGKPYMTIAESFHEDSIMKWIVICCVVISICFFCCKCFSTVREKYKVGIIDDYKNYTEKWVSTMDFSWDIEGEEEEGNFLLIAEQREVSLVDGGSCHSSSVSSLGSRRNSLDSLEEQDSSNAVSNVRNQNSTPEVAKKKTDENTEKDIHLVYEREIAILDASSNIPMIYSEAGATLNSQPTVKEVSDQLENATEEERKKNKKRVRAKQIKETENKSTSIFMNELTSNYKQVQQEINKILESPSYEMTTSKIQEQIFHHSDTSTQSGKLHMPIQIFCSQRTLIVLPSLQTNLSYTPPKQEPIQAISEETVPYSQLSNYYTTEPGEPIIIKTKNQQSIKSQKEKLMKADSQKHTQHPGRHEHPSLNSNSTNQLHFQNPAYDNTLPSHSTNECPESYFGLSSYQELPTSTVISEPRNENQMNGRLLSCTESHVDEASRYLDENSNWMERMNTTSLMDENMNINDIDVIKDSLYPGTSPQTLIDSLQDELESLSSKRMARGCLRGSLNNNSRDKGSTKQDNRLDVLELEAISDGDSSYVVSSSSSIPCLGSTQLSIF